MDELRLGSSISSFHKLKLVGNGSVLGEKCVRNKPDWSCVCVGVSRVRVRVQDSCTGLLAAGMSRRRAFRRARREARSCA